MKVPDFYIRWDPGTYAQLNNAVVDGGYSPYGLDWTQISTDNLAQAGQIR